MFARFESRRLVAVLTMVGALVTPSLAAAQARCFQWNVTQPWYALQDNGYTVEMHLTRNGPDLGGTATIRSPRGGLAKFGSVDTVRVVGILHQDTIELRMQGGVYRGSVEPSGRIVGGTTDEANPMARSRSRFVSDRNMQCEAFRMRSPGSNFGGYDNDILWHNAATGELQVWFMSGTSRVGRASIENETGPVRIGPPWRVVGNRDFNGNGHSDILWHNESTGETQLWLMNGTRILSPNRRTVTDRDDRQLSVGAPWRIVGTADVNNDGRSDIIWHNTASGAIQVWVMNGHKVVDRPMVRDEHGNVLVLAAPRRVAAVADMDDDGHPDLVVHNGMTGATQVFYLNSLKVLRRPSVVTETGADIAVGSPWNIVAANNFGHHAGADIVWHNAASGETQIWLMQGPQIWRRPTVDAKADGGGALVGLPWRIVNQ